MKFLPFGRWGFASLSVALVAVGCSSESDSATDDPNAAKKEEPTPSDPGPASAGHRTDFCGASADLAGRCTNKPSACDAELVKECSGLTKVANASLLKEAGACVAKASCGPAPTSCLSSSLVKAQPSEAQKALAKSFCASCAGSTKADACETAFFNPEGDASALAQLLLPVADPVVQEISTSCINASCKGTFTTCAEGIVTKRLAEALTNDGAQCFLKALAGNVPIGGTPPPIVDAGPPRDGGGPPGATFDLLIVEAEVPAAKSSGLAWDPFGGLPDPYVEVTLGGGAYTGKTSTQSDTTTPAFNEKLLVNIAADAIGVATIKMLDGDLLADDWIGDCNGALVAASDVQTFTCTPATSVYGPGFTLRYRLTPHP
jgi:C2 domain